MKPKIAQNNAAKKRAPPPIDNAHPTRNRKQRDTNQVYMYFSAEHTQLHTTPPCYVLFQPEVAQMTQQKKRAPRTSYNAHCKPETARQSRVYMQKSPYCNVDSITPPRDVIFYLELAQTMQIKISITISG